MGPQDHILIKLSSKKKFYWVWRTPNNEVVSTSKVYCPRGTWSQSLRSCERTVNGIVTRCYGVKKVYSKEVTKYITGGGRRA